MENGVVFSQKNEKMNYPHGPAISFWGIPRRMEQILKSYLYSLVHISTVYNNQVVEATQGSIRKRVDKQSVIYTCNGLLFNPLPKGNSDTRCNVKEPWRHCVTWNTPVSKTQILCDSTSVRCLEKFHSQRQERWGRRVYCLWGAELQVCEMKRIPEADGGDGCTTEWGRFTPLNCTLKMIKTVSFVMGLSLQLKII